MEQDIYWLKKKIEAGAEYAVTQMFYDNRKYFEFVEKVRKEGINVPIIPGIKPFRKLSQLNMIPKTFKIDLPQELASEAMKCQTDEEAESLGIEWCSRKDDRPDCKHKDKLQHGNGLLHLPTARRSSRLSKSGNADCRLRHEPA